jgi:hypothetical protein
MIQSLYLQGKSHQDPGWMDPKASLDMVGKKKNPLPWQELCPCFCIASHVLILFLQRTEQCEVRFQVLMVASMKMTVFWDVTPCGLVEVFFFV